MIRKLVFTVSLALCAPAFADETRCSALGTNCLCSEPLDTTTETNCFGGGQFFNPTDTNSTPCHSAIGASPDQCSFSQTDSSAGTHTYETETSMPAGNTVTKILRYNRSSGQARLYNDIQSSIATACNGSRCKRICTRSYQKYSTNYFDNRCNGGKTMELSGAQAGNNWSDGDYDTFSCRWGYNDGTGVNCGQVLSEFQPGDTLGQWVRTELCVSGSLGFGLGSQTVTVENVNTAVSGARAGQVNSFSLTVTASLDGSDSSGSGGRPIDEEYGKLANMFRGNDVLTCCPTNFYPTSPGVDCGNRPNSASYREVSYGMMAGWTTTSIGTFIGAATEVNESAGSSTGKLMWRRGASLNWPLPFMTMSFWSNLGLPKER